MSDNEGQGPKYRLEHAPVGQAVCNQAACKRAKTKFVKGELRIGTHTLFDREESTSGTWHGATDMAALNNIPINGLKELTGDDPTKAPGCDRLSSEAQEQVRLAFETGSIADKSFKGIRADLAGTGHQYGGEILGVEGYKIDMPTRPATCRANECAVKTNKVVKGELRVGFLKPFDGDLSTWVYKHWNCISEFDISALKECHQQDTMNGLDGLEILPATSKQAVLDTIRTSELAVVAKIEPPTAKPKKVRTKKAKVETDDEALEEAPKPKRSRKKRPVENVDSASESEPDCVPKKSKSRSKPKEEPADSAVANIEAMDAAIRDNAALG